MSDKHVISGLRANLEQQSIQFKRIEAENKRLIDRVSAMAGDAAELMCGGRLCEQHTGDNIEPFAEWVAKYGDKCLPCAIADNSRLRLMIKTFAKKALKEQE